MARPDWDLFDRQSRRLAIYDEAAERLREGRRLYPCYESAEELGLKRKVQLGQGKPPIYDRAALKLTDADRAKLEAEGTRAALALQAGAAQRRAGTTWCAGRSRSTRASQSDPVLIREDGSYLYTLRSVVDDIEFGITHVIRGNDHVTNTATQIQIFEALGARRRPSPICRCWWMRRAKGCRSASARCPSGRCARTGWSRWRSAHISRRSAPAIRSRRRARLPTCCADHDLRQVRQILAALRSGGAEAPERQAAASSAVRGGA